MSAETTNSAGSVSSRLLCALLAIWLAGAFGIFAFAGAMSLVGSRLAALIFAVGTAAFAAWLFWSHPIVPLDEKATSRALSIVFVLAAVASLVQLARLSVFIVNPAKVGYAMGPSRGMGLRTSHLCTTAYFVAAKSVATVPDIYDVNLYSLPTQNPDLRGFAPPEAHFMRKPRTIGPFDLDGYEYPPPFLLLPQTLAIVTPQLLNFRMLWFALNGSLVLIGLLAVARMFDPVIGTRVLLLSPLVLAADITIGTLQIENVEVAIFSLAMLAMVFFAQRRGPLRTRSLGWEGLYAAGGALLAFATVSKLFPGMLIVYLAVRREWRALAWTVGMCAALVGISFLDTGQATYRAFLHHLPRLLSGEAFTPLRNPGNVAANLSVPGLLFKLKLFGLPNGSYEGMKIVGSIYTLILLAATAVIARMRLTRNEQPIIWLVILILASLRSPFLPKYGLFPVLWLLILLVATAVPTVRTLSLVLLAWVTLNFTLPNTGNPMPLMAIAFVSQAIIIVLLALALRHQRQSAAVLQPVASPS